MLSVSVIGGYLGAGKTTLVNNLLRHANGTKIAVLVNEFGALPIDADLIEAQDDALISIAGGCVCCSYGNDLIQAMLDLAKLEQTPDHVVIESSGVALPGTIASSVSILDGFHVDGIVVLADAETIRDQARDPYVGDTIERQLDAAHIVLLNKADLVSATDLDAVQTWLTTMAPNASVIPVRHSNVPNDVILQNLAGDAPILAQSTTPHAPSFESRVIHFPQGSDAEAIAKRLADPALALIRAKGFVATPTGLRAIQIVGRRWTVSEAPQAARPGVIIIAQKTDTGLAEIERRLLSAPQPV